MADLKPYAGIEALSSFLKNLYDIFVKKTDLSDMITVDTENSNIGDPAPINADTFKGHNINDFVMYSMDEDGSNTPAEGIGALPITGGTMEGPINMNSQRIYGLSQPTGCDEAANKGYVDAKHTHATITLLASDWSPSAPYTQLVEIDGIQATDCPHVSPTYDTSDLDTALSQRDAWAMVSAGMAISDGILFACFEDRPDVDIPLQVEVNR